MNPELRAPSCQLRLLAPLKLSTASYITDRDLAEAYLARRVLVLDAELQAIRTK